MNRSLANRQGGAPANRPNAEQTNNTVSAWLTRPEVLDRIGGALAGWIAPRDFIAQILIALEDPKLRKCNARSKYEAAYKCAVLGLLPTLQQVALIPREIKNFGEVVVVMPQWQGYKALLERHPDVLEVTAHLVHNSDVFAYENGEVIHQYNPLDPNRRFEGLKDIKGGYCVVTWRDPQRPKKYHFCTADYIGRCRRCAETTKIWDAWFESMARKTVYRSAYSARISPVDPLVQNRIEAITKADDEVMGNDPDRVVDALPPTMAPRLPTVSRSQQLAQRVSHQPSMPSVEQQEVPDDYEEEEEESEPEHDGQDEETDESQDSPGLPSDDPLFAMKASLNECQTLGRIETVRQAALKHSPDHKDEINRICDAKRAAMKKAKEEAASQQQ